MRYAIYVVKVLLSSCEQIVTAIHPRIKEWVTYSLGRHTPHGGIRFDMSDDLFDSQVGAEIQPQAMTDALEVLYRITKAGVI
jgi:hypothetical protein